MSHSIAEDEKMRSLEEAILEMDGVSVARFSSEMVACGKHSHVRKVCLRTAHLAHERHCEGLVAALTSTGRSQIIEGVADALSAIMAGHRQRGVAVGRGARVSKSAPPKIQKPREAIERVLSDDASPVSNASVLPARMGAAWQGVVSLVIRAHDGRVLQEPIERNSRLLELFTGREGLAKPKEAQRDMRGVQLAALWAIA